MAGNTRMTWRCVCLAVLMATAGVARTQLQAVEPAAEAHLERLSLSLQDWSGRDGPPFESSVIALLRPDSYINRVYTHRDAIASVYVGYHRSQSGSGAIHSPLNCLPGSGWQPLRAERITLGPRGSVNRVVIQKGEERQLVLYWYHSPKRIEGNEFLSKIYLVLDAFTLRRNDAALVRIVVPIESRIHDGEGKAENAALRLARLIEPQVTGLLFSQQS
jgi:EpsI family protein